MKSATNLGIGLIMLGMVAVVYQVSIAYVTREHVSDLALLHPTVDNKRIIPLPPVVGGVALISGIALLIVGARIA